MNDHSATSPRPAGGDAFPKPIIRAHLSKPNLQCSGFLNPAMDGGEVFLHSAERKLMRLFREETEEYCYSRGLEALQLDAWPQGFVLDQQSEVARTQAPRNGLVSGRLRPVQPPASETPDPAMASGWFQRAFDLLPRPRNQVALGVSCLVGGESALAEDHLRNAIRTTGRSPIGYSAAINLGLLHMQIGRWRKARACFRWAQQCGYSYHHSLQQQAAGMEWVAGQLEGARLAVLKMEARTQVPGGESQVKTWGQAAQSRSVLFPKGLPGRRVGAPPRKLAE